MDEKVRMFPENQSYMFCTALFSSLRRCQLLCLLVSFLLQPNRLLGRIKFTLGQKEDDTWSYKQFWQNLICYSHWRAFKWLIAARARFQCLPLTDGKPPRQTIASSQKHGHSPSLELMPALHSSLLAAVCSSIIPRLVKYLTCCHGVPLRPTSEDNALMCMWFIGLIRAIITHIRSL